MVLLILIYRYIMIARTTTVVYLNVLQKHLQHRSPAPEVHPEKHWVRLIHYYINLQDL